MNKKITLVLAYYDNPQMLQLQYMTIARLSMHVREALDVIIVDDCSPRWHAYHPRDFDVPPVSLFRMRVDVRWNQDACRNIGVHESRTPWVLLTDMDHIVPAETWELLLQALADDVLNLSTAYTFRRMSAGCVADHDQLTARSRTPYKPHPNSWLMSRYLYDHVGGYDERLAGIYGTDGDFRGRLSIVAPIVELPAYLIRFGREVVPDASTTSYERKSPEDVIRKAEVKEQRAADPDKRPRRLTFAYDRM